MSYLLVNLYQHHPAETFEPDCVVQKLKDRFPEAEINPDDQLLVQVRNAEKYLSASIPSERAVLTKLSRDAQQQGPARAFTLVLDGKPIHGVVKRQLLQMTCEAPLTDQSLEEMKCFVRSLLPMGENLVIEEGT